jgi:ribose/xylose/arabinose/galactoside ABC-type transport system permease subunit
MELKSDNKKLPILPPIDAPDKPDKWYHYLGIIGFAVIFGIVFGLVRGAAVMSGKYIPLPITYGAIFIKALFDSVKEVAESVTVLFRRK